MADYIAIAESCLLAVDAVGGKIDVITTGEGEFFDPDKPWEGKTSPEANIPHVAALVPLSTILGREAQPFAECAIIPAAGLAVTIVEGSVFTDAGGRYYRVVNVQTIGPDMVTPIVYICEVATWPGT